MAATGDYSDWLSELDKYASSAGAGAVGGPAGLQGLNESSSGVSHKGRLNAVEQLEQEMKLLHWHKLANEAALKAALIRTKRLRDKDKQVMSQSKAAEKAAWMQRVVEEEQMKPLEVTDDFIRQYEQQERVESEKLEAEVERHIKNLQQLKQNLTEREELTKRHAVFRKKKKLLETTPIIVGGPEQSPGEATRADLNVSEDVEGGETVAASLNKLVELEKRIAQLEVNDRPPSARRPTPGSSRLSARSGGSTGMSGTALVFRKKRTATRLDAPAKTVYSVQMVDKSRARSRGSTPGSRRLQARAQARQQRAARERARNDRQGAIINNWMQERKAKEQSRRRRNQQRLVQSKARASAARRQYGGHAPAPGRGASTQPVGRRTRGGAAARRRQGPAAGARQQFHDVRKQFEDARDNARRSLAGVRSGYSGRGTGAGGGRATGRRTGGRTTGSRWANQRGSNTRSTRGAASKRPTGQSFKFSTRGTASSRTQPQVGSRLRAGPSTRTTSRRPRPTANTTRPQRSRQPRSGAAAAAAARAAARRRAAAAQATSKHASRRRGARKSTGFGTSGRFKRKARATAPARPRFGGGVSGRGVNARPSRAHAAPRRGYEQGSRRQPTKARYGRGTRSKSNARGARQARGTTLPVIGRRA